MQPTAELPLAADSAEPTSPVRSRKRRWLYTALALLGVVAVLGGIKAGQIRAMIASGESFVPPPEAVTSATVQRIPWAQVRAAVGTLVADRGVTLSAELPGTVRQILFENGASVKAGDVLVRLDTSIEAAQLEAASADAALAAQNLERIQRLHEGGSVPQQELDAAKARDQQARAAVANVRAVISKKVLRAPFAGRTGIRAVELGQVVSPGAPVVSLQSVTPVHAEFQLPEQVLASLTVGQKVRVAVDAFPERSWEGKVTTVSPEVDPATRNVRIRATVDNADGKLAPGMYARVQVESESKGDVLVVPATSVIFAPYGDSVYVVEKQQDAKAGGEKAGAAKADAPLVANQRFVRLGERRGDFVVVTEGLKEGEQVVSNGAFKLRNGQTVAVNNALAPKNELAPAPTER